MSLRAYIDEIVDLSNEEIATWLKKNYDIDIEPRAIGHGEEGVAFKIKNTNETVKLFFDAKKTNMTDTEIFHYSKNEYLNPILRIERNSNDDVLFYISPLLMETDIDDYKLGDYELEFIHDVMLSDTLNDLIIDYSDPTRDPEAGEFRWDQLTEQAQNELEEYLQWLFDMFKSTEGLNISIDFIDNNVMWSDELQTYQLIDWI